MFHLAFTCVIRVTWVKASTTMKELHYKNLISGAVDHLLCWERVIPVSHIWPGLVCLEGGHWCPLCIELYIPHCSVFVWVFCPLFWTSFGLKVLLALKCTGMLCWLKTLLSFSDPSRDAWNDTVALFVLIFSVCCGGAPAGCFLWIWQKPSLDSHKCSFYFPSAINLFSFQFVHQKMLRLNE